MRVVDHSSAPFPLLDIPMQTSSPSSASRKLYPELQILCNTLQTTQGGFLGMLLRINPADCDLPLTSKAIQANKGRKLYPQLQYFCDALNSGKKLY
jgi:hypothetical protein